MFICYVCGCYGAAQLNDWKGPSHFPSGHLLLLKVTTQLLDAPSDFLGAELQGSSWCPGLG